MISTRVRGPSLDMADGFSLTVVVFFLFFLFSFPFFSFQKQWFRTNPHFSEISRLLARERERVERKRACPTVSAASCTVSDFMPVAGDNACLKPPSPCIRYLRVHLWLAQSFLIREGTEVLTMVRKQDLYIIRKALLQKILRPGFLVKILFGFLLSY